MDSTKHAILEDFLDDVNKEDVVQRDIQPGKDDSYSFLLTGRIDFPERAGRVKTELDNLMDSTPAISRYDVMVYPLQQQADIMNQGDLEHEYIIVRFSLQSYFRTPQRAVLFLQKMVRLFDVVSNSTQRLILYEFRQTDEFSWISARTNTIMMFLDFLLSPVQNKEKIAQLKEKSYELASLMNRQIFDTVGVLTHNWKATAFFIDNHVGYFDVITKKIAGYGIVAKKELKLHKPTTDYFTGKTIDLNGLWQISRYTSNYIYSAEAMLFTDLIDRKFAYGLLDTRSEEAHNEIKRLEKDNAEIKISDIKVMYSSKATTWRGYGEFQICLWLGSYETPDDKAVAVYNVFLLIGGARQWIDHVVTYLEGLLNERLPQKVTDDLFRANAALNVK